MSTPMPPAAFSTLATTRSIASVFTKPGTKSRTALRPGLPTTSPRIRIRIVDYLPCVFNGSHLADHGDLDLPGIGHLALDLTRHPGGLLVGDRIMLNNDPDLAAGLDGVGFLHSLKGIGNALQFFQATN